MKFDKNFNKKFNKLADSIKEIADKAHEFSSFHQVSLIAKLMFHMNITNIACKNRIMRMRQTLLLEPEERNGLWYNRRDALLPLMTWQDGIYIGNGWIYIRRLEGEQWAVGHEDEPGKSEELFDDPVPAIERFLQRLKEFNEGD